MNSIQYEQRYGCCRALELRLGFFGSMLLRGGQTWSNNFSGW